MLAGDDCSGWRSTSKAMAYGMPRVLHPSTCCRESRQVQGCRCRVLQEYVQGATVVCMAAVVCPVWIMDEFFNRRLASSRLLRFLLPNAGTGGPPGLKSEAFPQGGAESYHSRPAVVGRVLTVGKDWSLSSARRFVGGTSLQASSSRPRRRRAGEACQHC